MVERATDTLSRIDALLEVAPAGLLLLFGIPLMLVGAEWLVRGSVALARHLGVSTLLIGLTIVSAGTSAPELAINVIAATGGNTGLSFGNVIGSNIANVGLVIGIGALIAPMAVHSRVLRIELPWVVIISILTIGLAMIPLRWKLGRGDVLTMGFGWIDGLFLLCGFFAFAALWYRTCKVDQDDPLTREVLERVDGSRPSTASLMVAIALFLFGLAGLLIGGKLTEVGAVSTASYLDLSHAVIGMTVVAVSTSLPELVTTIIACRRGYTDLAMGNIVGSNIFNILLVLGATTLIADVPVPGATGWQDLLTMVAFSMLLWWIASSGRPEVARHAGAMLLVSYVGYIAWSVVREVMFVV